MIVIVTISLLVIAVTSSFVLFELATLSPKEADTLERIFGQSYADLDMDQIVKVVGLFALVFVLLILGLAILFRAQIENEKLKLKRDKEE